MPSDSQATFGQVLRRYRQAARLSQDELALKAGLSTRAISDLERGINRSPRKATLTLLADALGLGNEERHCLEEAAQPVTAPTLHNLPVLLTSFIGREAEIAAIRRLLGRAEGRLVTLTGPGGSGKTRLALEVAGGLRADFVDGVWFVDLAPLRDPALVVPTIAKVLGVQEKGPQLLVERLQAFLREKQLLLVLDNCEQVVAAGPVVSALLQGARRLQVLTTSRVPLRLRGEKRVTVPPLTLPHLQQASLVQVVQAAAVRLFVERAHDVAGDFTLTAANAHAVVEICVRLDGLPLALELAAARIHILPPQVMLAHLQNRLGLLTGGVRDLPERQQTLRAAIAWSYDLLSPREQQLFRRLAVFAGGATLEAIEAVCNSGGDLGTEVLESLPALVDGNLLQQTSDWAGAPRFTMLETITEYAEERLREHGEHTALSRCHAEYFLALAEAAESELQGRRQTEWLERLEQEHHNLRRALEWSIGADEESTSHRLELGLRLAGTLRVFWEQHSHLNEGREWLAGLLAKGRSTAEPRPRPAVIAKAVDAAARLAYKQADWMTALQLYTESLERHRQLQSPQGIARALGGLGHLARARKDLITARAYYEEALALRRALGDQWGIASVLFVLGQLEIAQGDVDRSARLFEESLILCRELGDTEGIGYALEALGQVALVRGDYAESVRCTEAAVVLFRELGNKGDIADALDTLGWLAMYDGDYLRAATLLEEAIAFYQDAERNSTDVAWPLARLGIVAAEQGDQIRAKALLEQSLARLRDRELLASEATGLWLWGFAALAGAAGYPERMARLMGAAEAWYETASVIDRAFAEGKVTPRMAVVRAQVDAAAWAAGQAAGRAMTLEQALAYALEQDG
jgi:predicted ATPase/DNA-binding XRE family transcriptional regulator